MVVLFRAGLCLVVSFGSSDWVGTKVQPRSAKQTGNQPIIIMLVRHVVSITIRVPKKH